MVYKDVTGKTRRNVSDEVCIAPKTVVIVFKQQKHLEHQINGERLFAKFKCINSGCTWNQQFCQCMKKLVLVGSLRPHTLLVYGTSDHVEALRSAWIKNLLRSPQGFSILYFGELPSLYIEPVCQTSFTPLPDALCSIILQMNRSNTPATITSLKKQLAHHYSHVRSPSDQVVFESLNTLLREKKICLTDTGYYITSHQVHNPVIVSNDHGEVYMPLLLLSPAKSGSSSNDDHHKHSPKKKANVRRSKSLNLKTRHQSKAVNELGDKLNNCNIWNNDHQKQQAGKPKVKDKGAALRKLFGMKPKKKNCKSGSSSGSSTTPSAPVSNEDEPTNGNEPITAPYVLDSRTTSQLTSAMVPIRISPMPMNRTENDSLMVHCGKTIVESSSSNSDYESDENQDRVDDWLPDIKKISYGLRKSRQRISKPVSKWRRHRHYSGSTSDPESICELPTAEMYFERKRYKTIYSQRKMTRQRNIETSKTPPNVSSIHSSGLTGITAPNNSSDSNLLQDGSRSAEGENRIVAHHSTPKEDNVEKAIRQIFNATGHSQCAVNDNCCDADTSPRKTRSFGTKSSSEKFRKSKQSKCECEKLKCICSCPDSELSSEDSKVITVQYNNLGKEASL